MPDFAGKVALITGGAAGIGAASARRLAELGARIVIADINAELGTELVAELGDRHRFVPLDVSSQKAWIQLMADLDDEGGIDILFLNAGVLVRPPTVPILDDPLPWITEQAFHKVVEVNMGGVVYGIVAALPYLRERDGASILITSSRGGVTPFAPDPLYSMTKHALVGLGRSLAPTLAKLSIDINVLCPGGIQTMLTPSDLIDNPEYDYKVSPPSFTAEAVATILSSGRTGAVWLAYGKTPVHELEFP
jgi:NAD(P)-dependent dehydrogenase (short-subunit alcohol dehydrogenase family)